MNGLSAYIVCFQPMNPAIPKTMPMRLRLIFSQRKHAKLDSVNGHGAFQKGITRGGLRFPKSALHLFDGKVHKRIGFPLAVFYPACVGALILKRVSAFASWPFSSTILASRLSETRST